jgi:hypothetical protein
VKKNEKNKLAIDLFIWSEELKIYKTNLKKCKRIKVSLKYEDDYEYPHFEKTKGGESKNNEKINPYF